MPTGAVDGGVTIDGLDSDGATPESGVGTPTGSGPGRSVGNGSAERVTLITGQTVTVRSVQNETRYSVDAAVPMTRTTRNGDTFVYPESVDFEIYDRALFNVDRLLEHPGVGNGSVPVIVVRESVPAGSVSSVSGFEQTRTLESIDATAGTVDPGVSAAAGGALDSHPATGRVYLDRYYEVTLNDSTETVDADTARRRYGVSGEGVTVAVLDTGVNESHPDLDGGTEVYEEDFTEEGTTEDRSGHGTHVAGIVAGHGDASDGEVTGVAPNASIMDMRVLDSSGGGTASGIIDGMETAVERDADVLSMSLGDPPSEDDPLASTADWATEQGALVVAAAGNLGSRGSVGSPGIASGALTVGAVDDETGEIAEFSSRGPTEHAKRLKPDIVAPGVDIRSACAAPDCSYVTISGTSMATPHVSGAAALVRAAHPDWSARRVRSALLTSADPLTNNGTPVGAYTQGIGLLDVDEAVDQRLLLDDATLSLGSVGGSVVSRNVSVTNTGTGSRTLTVSATVRDIETGSTVGGVTLNRSTLTVAPGDTETVQVRVDPEIGVYSGRITFAGENTTQTAVLGYVSKATIRVDKRGLGGSSTVGDVVTFRPYDGATYNDWFVWDEAQQAVIGDGAVEFHTDSSRGLLYSFGRHERTGVPVLTLREVNVSRGRTVVLDESATVEHTVDTSRLDHTNLTTVRAEPAGRFYVDLPICGDTVPKDRCFFDTTVTNDSVAYFTREPTVRYTPHPAFDALSAFRLVPAGERDPDERGSFVLDSPTVYDLTYTENSTTTAETYRPDEPSLGALHADYHQTHPTEQYTVALDRVSDVNDFDETPRWWLLDDPVNQTRYVRPDRRYELSLLAPNEEWEWSTDGQALGPGEHVTVAPGRHPVQPTYWGWNLSESSTGSTWLAMEPTGRLKVTFNSLESILLTLREDGRLVDSSPYRDDVFYLPMHLPPVGTTYNVTQAYGQSVLNRSSRIVASARGTWHESGDPTPPRINSLEIGALDRYNRITAATTAVRIETNSSPADLTLGYATATDPSTPLTAAELRRASDWTVVGVNETRPKNYTGTVDIPVASGGLHLAVVATDARGDTTTHIVEDAAAIDLNAPSGISLDAVQPANGSAGSVGLGLRLSNDGDLPISRPLNVTVDGTTLTKTVTVPGNSTVERYVSLANASLPTGVHTATVSTDKRTESVTVAVREGAYSMPGSTAGATTVDDDPLLEDVDGDGTLDRDDVLAYYEHRDSDVVRNNPARFDFDGDGVAGTVSDALALYGDL